MSIKRKYCAVACFHPSLYLLSCSCSGINILLSQTRCLRNIQLNQWHLMFICDPLNPYNKLNVQDRPVAKLAKAYHGPLRCDEASKENTSLHRALIALTIF